jgi:hypothetical protein
MYDQLQIEMEEIYTQAKEKYFLNMRKILTERKLMSLSMGKSFKILMTF